MRSLAEWLLALGLLGGLAWIGSPVVKRLAPPISGSVTVVESALPGLPSGVPGNAESVPLLMLLDGGVVRLGMTERELRTGPLSQWLSGTATAEKGVIDSRAILPFQAQNTRFWVVLDRTTAGQERRVTAIYLR